jgi:hypothetical protein
MIKKIKTLDMQLRFLYLKEIDELYLLFYIFSKIAFLIKNI